MNDLAAAFTMCLFIGWLCWLARDSRKTDERCRKSTFVGNTKERGWHEWY